MRLQTRNNKLVLSGTNIDIDLEATLDTDLQGEGDIALPAVVLAQVVRSLPGDTVQLEATPEDLRVTSGTFDTKLQLAQIAEAPTLNFPDAYEGTFDGQAFARALGVCDQRNQRIELSVVLLPILFDGQVKRRGATPTRCLTNQRGEAIVRPENELTDWRRACSVPILFHGRFRPMP